MTRAGWIYGVPLVLLLAVTLPHLDQGDFRTDTARYAAIGVQAWRDPALLWTPHLHPSVPYFNKPPLALWVHGFFLHFFGVSVWMARLPSVLAAAGIVSLTVAIVRRSMGNVVAVSSGAILALTYEFFRRTREISLDLWQLLFLMAALWCCIRAVRINHPKGLCWAGIPLGFALLCKPLTALLLIPIVAAWLIAEGRKSFLIPLVGVSLIACAVAAPWHLSMVALHSKAFTAAYFGREVLGRLRGDIGREPVWYYAAEIGRTYWPWMLLLPPGLLAWRRTASRSRSLLRLSLLWLCVWLLALTLFPDKRPRYELPLYPALALVAAAGLTRIPSTRFRSLYRRRLPLLAALALIAALVSAWMPLRVQTPPDKDWMAVQAWMRQAGIRSVYSGALSTNDEGYFYLKTGYWPEPIVRDGARPTVAPLPPGAHLIYDMELYPRPGRNETVVFRSGRLWVTEIGDGSWQPVLPSRNSL